MYSLRSKTFFGNDVELIFNSLTAPGFNAAWNVQPLGDMDFDGDRDFDDIDDFVLGLQNRSEYVALYGESPDLRGDINGSGFQDFDDISGFVDILSNGAMTSSSAIPEPSTFVLAITMLFFATVFRSSCILPLACGGRRWFK